jgi:ABC-type uncharacterized transport system auxiliary subunit
MKPLSIISTALSLLLLWAMAAMLLGCGNSPAPADRLEQHGPGSDSMSKRFTGSLTMRVRTTIFAERFQNQVVK